MKRVWTVLAVMSWMAAALRAAPVAVIQGCESVAAGERRFAQALARHVERWYREAGVEAALVLFYLAGSAMLWRDQHRTEVSGRPIARHNCDHRINSMGIAAHAC